MDAIVNDIISSSPSSLALCFPPDQGHSVLSTTSLDAPGSPLSDVPDDLSDCSEAKADQFRIRPLLMTNIDSVQPSCSNAMEGFGKDGSLFDSSFKRRVTRSQTKKQDLAEKITTPPTPWPKRSIPSPISPIGEEFSASPRLRKKRKSNADSLITKKAKRASLVVKLSVPSLGRLIFSQLKQTSLDENTSDQAISASDFDHAPVMKFPDIPTGKVPPGGRTELCILEQRAYVPCNPPTATPNHGPGLDVPMTMRASPSGVEHSELVALAKRLVTPPTDFDQRPDPSSRPEVWAETRQELCETLHYFRAWHGGTYCTGGYAWGVLHDKSPHARDFNDGIVVLSRAGGGMVRDKDTEEMVIGRDQAENSQSASLRNSMKYRNPVVLITGADNPLMRCKPPHTYCVLDYFKPTHIWCEKSGGRVIMRYRFEKLNLSKPSWWLVGEQAVPLGSLPPPVVQRCTSCGNVFDQVYLQGWMCLHAPCRSFWKLQNGKEPVEHDLLYDPRFIKQKTHWPNENHNYSLTSNNVQLSGHFVAGENCSKAYWSGMVCPQCGRCILRISWMCWDCGCGFQKKPPHTLIPAEALVDPYFPLTDEYSLSRDFSSPLVTLEVRFLHGYRINVFTIPGINGFVAHLIANKPVVEEQGGPNDMFEELQQTDIGLRRRPLGGGLSKGEAFTRHFAVNYGMPYKFIAATSSEPFEGAAHAITATRSRLNWASQLMVGQEHREFNEVLALGYFEEQRINYHDDGEFGLGPTIATLSLGAPGTMKIRMKARHYNGVSKQGIYNDSLPMPGCDKYAERLAAVDELARLKATDKKEYSARLRTLPKNLGLKSGGNSKDAITMMLGHGDIVIMHGADIQKYYEHSVEHAGKLRFALTCRYIDPDSLSEADKPKYPIAPDAGNYDGTRVGGVA
ncbi:uncharacterized protein EI97DRAFT_437781 [Westerdykella ornata]|uniref:Alpha-ketoglutarate-dependent dioxygenase AlkB-like domain-containing protein n=1 Tax=Westerdykella ornata TaxID=318751 RepID=A0A6A6J4M8_WESOR|nr:uncharacterized protein EI97DRAFT_437781 [Westerdykella ornata]KAF2271531.1 hypothetical protein EI97DRAFT_437781 [Westerdykella ornata]